jgi:plasmid stabilization system protein ParE
MEVRISEAAALSIIEQADYYRSALDNVLAERWESAVGAAIQSLLQFPGRGALCRFLTPKLASIRWIFVPSFEKHMIFYRYDQQENMLLVVQVLHGARDLKSLLNDDPAQM